MNLQEWIAQLPKDWQDDEAEECARCAEGEVWDYLVCITCAEELNEEEW